MREKITKINSEYQSTSIHEFQIDDTNCNNLENSVYQ